MRMKMPVTVLAIAMMASLLPLPAAATATEEPSASDNAPNSDLERSLDPPRADTLFSSTSQVIVHGGGWGHGIGMSQHGARAMAAAGKSHEEILKHFYTGIQFGTVAPAGTIIQHADPIRIGVGPNRVSVSFKPIGGPGELCLYNVIEDGGAQQNGGEEPTKTCFTTSPGEQWFLYGRHATPNPGENCLVTNGSLTIAEMPECKATLEWTDQPNTRMQFPGIGRTYARGWVDFSPQEIQGVPGYFNVNVVTTMDEYLYGLGEVPSSWPMEAMKAQAIAARTFALYRIWAIRNLPDGVIADCACHLRPTTVDQSYLGWYTAGMTEGTSSTGANWRQAVHETSGKAVWHTQHGNTRAAEAYYFSSTGGSTENNEDRWGGSPYQYLRSKSDPGATSWKKGFTYNGFASALGFSSITWVEITERYVSGRPKTISVQGMKNGSTTTQNFTAFQFQQALGLTSQYVSAVEGFLMPGASRTVLHNPTTGEWSYRNANGTATTIYYGNPGDYAIFGDWNCDGTETPGLYRQSDGYVYLRNSNTQGNADITFFFGNPGDIPIVGDFNGDECDTVSLYRPSQARFYIINALGTADKGLGAADYWFEFGNPGDVPFAGDWNGNGIDTPGLRRPSDGLVYLRNSNSQGVADITYFFGNPGDYVFVGDWNANGKDSLGLYRPSTGTIFLRNSLSGGVADITYQMGSSVHRPVAGKY
jgi:SpoIID/LytB domain protein